MAKSLNRVQLIGNLTRDPELRYTPNGTAVCSFGLATNRSWTTDSGEKKDEVEFHRIVAWSKLAELCSQFLAKGRKVFLEGRLQTRQWEAQDGTKKQSTEIVISDMILLDSKRPQAAEEDGEEKEEENGEKKSSEAGSRSAGKEEKKASQSSENKEEEEVAPDDIPF